MGQFYKAVLLNDARNAIRHWVGPEPYGADATLAGHALRSSPFVAAVEMLLTEKGGFADSPLVWAGDYADPEPQGEGDLNLYKLCGPSTERVPEESDTSLFTYIVNHTKKQFISKERTEKYTDLHPLPLLTCEGHGRGYGGYNGDHALIGYWARDSISMEKRAPRGYMEIVFDLGKQV